MGGGGAEKSRDISPEQMHKITDVNTLILEALKNGALSAAEGREIITRLKDEKNKITSETKTNLERFLKDIKGWDGLKQAVNKAHVAGTPEVKTAAKSAEKPAETQQVDTSKPAEKATDSTPPTTQETPSQDGFMDKTGRFFTGKIDLNTLPKEDQALIGDLQKTGFKLTPIEGKPGLYEVDMNTLGDNSKLDTKNKTFTTDRIKNQGKDFTTSFKDASDLKEKMTKSNMLINTLLELHPLDAIYETNRDHFQQAQYQKLTTQKAALEKDLGITASAPAGTSGDKK